MDQDDVVQAARQRRVALYGAMVDLEASLAAPSGRATWVESVRRDLGRVAGALAAHIDEVERPGGIMARIVLDVPHLSSRVAALTGEHPGLTEEVVEVATRLDALGDPPDEDEADELRDAALGLLGALARHRHRGADLVYDAFAIEMGGG